MRSTLLIISGIVFLSGCASTQPLPKTSAYQPSLIALPRDVSYHYQVQPGDTLWGIAHDFGWQHDRLAAINNVSNARQIKVGQPLVVPPPPESDRFLWPARGRTSSEGSSVFGSSVISIRAPESSLVRASRSGKVAVASNELSGWGKTILLDHGDGYVSIYSGMGQIMVLPGAFITQGTAIGRAGKDPIYFGIRYNAVAKNPKALLP
jgi:murein DD-endopeptidase MepM/ murein hydrolase activator NlpD